MEHLPVPLYNYVGFGPLVGRVHPFAVALLFGEVSLPVGGNFPGEGGAQSLAGSCHPLTLCMPLAEKGWGRFGDPGHPLAGGMLLPAGGMFHPGVGMPTAEGFV